MVQLAEREAPHGTTGKFVKMETGAKVSEMEPTLLGSTAQEIPADLEMSLRELVAKHLEAVRAALMTAEAETAQVKDKPESTATGRMVREAPIPPQKRVLSPEESTVRGQIREIPLHKYAAQFTVDSQQERREVEIAASRYMDGFHTGADWVMFDRRTGTVKEWDESRGFGFLEEDLTQQEIFVNRRAVKHQAEPKWRHNLRVGERVTFAKLGSRRGLWAVAVLRVPDLPDRVEKPPSPRGRQETPVRADSPTAGHVIGGSVHAEGYATVHLETHQYSPPAPATKKLAYVVAKQLLPDSSQEELQQKVKLPAPEPRFSPPRLPVTVSSSDFVYPLGLRSYEGMTVNPYLHRGPAYSSIRGPGIRRRPSVTRTRLGEWVFRPVI